MKRISVIGSSGSGKTTLSRRLAARLDAPHLELDSLYHQAGWRPLPRDELRARVAERLTAERWVVDGNYSSNVRDLVWDAADTVVWLDLPRRAILPGLVTRTLRRMWTREELWNGNRERWTNLFDPRPDQNVILWMLTQHRRQRRGNARDLATPERAHLAVHRLTTRAEADAFAEAQPSNAASRESAR